MRVSVLCALLAIRVATGAEWGPSVNGLRMSLAREGENIVVTFENNREMFLPLGRAVGSGSADFLRVDLIAPDGTRRQLQYIGGSGIAPSRILPYIVPMMAGSLYSVRTPLRKWLFGTNYKEIDAKVLRGAALQASIEASETLHLEYIDCYGLQMFWSGHAASNALRWDTGGDASSVGP